ncbi:MAG: hypothetical protein ACPGRC_11435 [Salibacteraceae bacterium]
MKNLTSILTVISLLFMISCSDSAPKSEVSADTSTVQSQEEPKEMLKQAYQLFKEGDDAQSIELANQVLEIGKATQNDTLVGRALTSLCRNSQRNLDTVRLAQLSEQLVKLSEKSGEQKWLMYMAHMNAEMWRLIGNMNKAEIYYNQSMEISHAIGAKGMYTIDHFNKSFVSVAQGDFETAKQLISKYYQLRKEDDSKSEDAYGLIALAYYLEQQENYPGAHEVATVTRRLFKEQNLFPEPPDEKPLLMVEEKVKGELDTQVYDEISKEAVNQSVNSLLAKYLG